MKQETSKPLSPKQRLQSEADSILKRARCDIITGDKKPKRKGTKKQAMRQWYRNRRKVLREDPEIQKRFRAILDQLRAPE
jgi:hypothetical protein